ncbi:MAG TPA: hypothetical protein VL309_11945 [Vicinamibacterales bacterium]|jgi:hypothetical protein|nr:hypothetical protein [Vicinamibacterales bacterium]
MSDRLIDLSKHELAAMLTPAQRGPFLEKCAAIERRYTEECACHEPCLESGCSVAGTDHEACLQPLLRSEDDYRRECVAAWLELWSGNSPTSAEIHAARQ